MAPNIVTGDHLHTAHIITQPTITTARQVKQKRALQTSPTPLILQKLEPQLYNISS